jgi:F0F1-type ATP synthase epsilon subunit
MANKSIKVVVKDTEKIIFDGEVERISSFNEVGPFDVFPMHANFISIIRQQLTLFHEHKKIQDLKIEQAVMKVKKDIVSIFLGIEVLTIDDNSEQSAPKPQDKQPSKTP